MFSTERLSLVPEHMRHSIQWWIEQGEPCPQMMGSFQYALLTNNLHDVFQYGDDENLRSLPNWMTFLHQDAPAACWGSRENVEAWYAAMHRKREASL